MHSLTTHCTVSLKTFGSLCGPNRGFCQFPCDASSDGLSPRHMSYSCLSCLKFSGFWSKCQPCFFVNGTNVMLRISSNSAISSFKIPTCHRMIISAAPFVFTLRCSVTAALIQFKEVIESVLTLIFFSPYFNARVTPFIVASSSTI